MSEQGCVPCALVLEENHLLYSVCRPLGVLVARRQRHRPSGLVWSGDDIFARGTWRPPPFLVKLLRGKRDQGDRDCVHGRDLIAGSNTLCECFNNVDVGVPLWLTEPRDKSSSQRVCFLSSPFKFPHFILQLVCLYFSRVVS